MGEPLDPNYQPPPPFATPEQWSRAQAPLVQPYPGAYSAASYERPFDFSFRPWEPPRPSYRRRNWIIVVAIVAVLALAGLGVYALSSGSSTERLAIPQSFDGYTQEHDATSDRVESTMRGMRSGLDSETKHVIDSASVGLYAADLDVSQKVIILAMPTSAVAGVGPPDEATSHLMGFMGGSVSDYPAGPHGGSLRCGQTTMGIVTESGCSWSDATSTGLIISVHQGGQPLTPQGLSAVTQALQDQID